MSEVQPLELNHNISPFPVGYDSSSSAPHNIQHRIDSVYIPVLTVARQKATQRGLPFHPMIQVVGQFDELGNPVGVRDPQRPEIYAQVFLALAHGAKGIGYFTYVTGYHNAPFARLIAELPPDSLGEVTGPFPPSNNIALHGLVDWNTTSRRFEPNYKWFAVRHADSLLDKIGPVLLDLTWDTAKIANSPIRYLDSLKSAQFSTPYVEAGFFKDSVNTDYFMLVNRRVLSTEGQDVTAWLNKSGHSYVIDMFSGDTVLTGNVGGGAPFTTRLNPGEGKLFKVVPAPQYINNNVAFPLTWQGKITMDGDVTVSSGKTLKILPPKAELVFLANQDTTHSGGDPTKSEMIVNGTLTCVGTYQDPILFTTSGSPPLRGDWGGIFVAHPGRMDMAFTTIRYADAALSVRDTCTVRVRNSTLSHVKSFAVYSKSVNVNLGAAPGDCGRNNILMLTSVPGAKAVRLDPPAYIIKAEGDYWGYIVPDTGWFVGDVDYEPYLSQQATDTSTCPIGGGGGGGCEGDQPCAKITVVDGSRPSKFDLAQNYPNPFNAATVIRFALPQASRVELRIYNILGQVVRSFIDEKPAGFYEALWDGRDENGIAVSSGIYLYQIRAGDFVQTKKMQLVK